MTNEQKFAYLAGIVDGEGCIGAYNVRQSGASKSPYAQITVRVAMVTPFAVKVLHETFGGTLRVRSRSNVRRTVFEWTVRNIEAESCLRCLLPLLQEKREQAEVALTLADLRRSRHRTTRLTSTDINERETYVQKIKDLKRVEYDPTSIH